MNFSIVIPAHNEADVIHLTLESLTKQTLPPKQIVVVNDNSSDNTQQVVEKFTENYSYIQLINNISSNAHLPGTKIINAFYKGFTQLNQDFDIICKFDADLVFPNNYLEHLSLHFKKNLKTGMAAGFCYIKKNNEWVLENLTDKDHIRGALKAYTKDCFTAIGQLKTSMGWDTIDELLAKYYGYEILTIESLHVKHLKPTGTNYSKSAKYLQGEAMYKMRYGFTLTFLSALKLGLKKKNFIYFKNYLLGYLKSMIQKPKKLVDKSQGKFIRSYRWNIIKNKYFR